jgi:uncharacterized protein YjbJ (UPF0337 family)
MDKNRVKGSADQAMGAIKEAAGKLTGDTKLEAEGKADKLKGKVENAVGGAKDAVRQAARNLDRRLDLDSVARAGSAVRDAVKTRPVEALAVAAGVGALLGALIARA